MTKERMEEMNKLKNIINSLDDSADADDFHKFVDTCQINYEEGVFNEILRFMQSQAERVKELEEENKRHRQLIYFFELKLDDFEKSAHMISRLTDEKLVERDAKALEKDIEGTMKVMEDEQ